MRSYFTNRFEMPSAVMPTIETLVAIGTAICRMFLAIEPSVKSFMPAPCG